VIDRGRVELFLREHLRYGVLLAELLLGRKSPIFLDYPINPVPRYGYGKPPHKRLYELINEKSEIYKYCLTDFVGERNAFSKISRYKQSDSDLEPYIDNDFFPLLDAFVQYSLLNLNDPKRYFEIGSGESTKFARRAIRDFGLRTKITSIDPFPRSRIDELCDVLVRKPVEGIDLEIFQSLEEGDILFVDSSHRVFQNSDVTVCFLDIIPYLKPGVLVHFHDILLPWDYSQEYGGQRYYSEQYLLAAFILGEGNRFEIFLPNHFISQEPQFGQLLQRFEMGELRGSSFWIRMN
jgi:hypothetical protein|tara:strand:- start:2170 stop:3048 length:879 start_codon:yes stop_codon:yes gene_type:complete